jgi:hypothetical protein
MIAIELSTLLTGFRHISSGSAVIDLTKETIKEKCPPEYGRLYDTVRVLMTNRSILDETSRALK